MKFGSVKYYLLVLLISCGFYTNAQETPPLNIIMVIADGMGPAYPTAYRYYKNIRNNDKLEPTTFDNLLVGTSSTYPHEKSGFVTDSAASATALATGVKTYNRAIGVDINKKPVESILEFAKKVGKNTGIVVTSEIYHATPASYLSHVTHRKKKQEIADSYFDEKINGHFKADVMLGGGQEFFIRNDRNLVNEFINSNYQYIDNYSALATVNNKQKLLGLFAPQGLPAYIDDDTKNRLTLMTQTAIEQLANISPNNNGFFLLVEASQIDWAAHDNDVLVVMNEIAELEHTMQYLVQYADKTPNTLIVLTSDHSTGGFSIGATKDYRWHPELLHKIKMSPSQITNHLIHNKINHQYLNTQLGFDLTTIEVNELSAIKTNLLELYKNSNTAATEQEKEFKLKTLLVKNIRDIINQRTNTGWSTIGHTGIDVNVYSYGLNKELFRGFQDNTDIAKKLFTLIKEDKSRSK